MPATLEKGEYPFF